VPPVTIREALINAIVHADYAQRGSPIRVAVFDDRIEIENPGLLPFGLTVDDIQRGVSKLRNRVIGRVFHELRLIEQWGSGIQRMNAACLEAGLEAPKLEEIGTHFRVTIPALRVRKPKTDETDRRILDSLRSETLSTAAIASVVGLSERATRSRLRSLVSRGLVVEIGTGLHDPKRHYALGEIAT
jgi:ATP-dependent DNA helicase RecG